MKAFRFSLERVLEWRGIQLRSAEEQLSQLQRQIQSLAQQEERVLAVYKESAGALLSSTTMAGGDLQSLEAFRERTNRLHQRLRMQRARCEALLPDQRQRLLKARKEHRVVQKLKERQQQSWTYLNDREIESAAAEAHLVNWVNANAQMNIEDERT